jgi:hypothetical protein
MQEFFQRVNDAFASNKAIRDEWTVTPCSPQPHVIVFYKTLQDRAVESPRMAVFFALFFPNFMSTTIRRGDGQGLTRVKRISE